MVRGTRDLNLLSTYWKQKKSNIKQLAMQQWKLSRIAIINWFRNFVGDKKYDIRVPVFGDQFFRDICYLIYEHLTAWYSRDWRWPCAVGTGRVRKWTPLVTPKGRTRSAPTSTVLQTCTPERNHVHLYTCEKIASMLSRFFHNNRQQCLDRDLWCR